MYNAAITIIKIHPQINTITIHVKFVSVLLVIVSEVGLELIVTSGCICVDTATISKLIDGWFEDNFVGNADGLIMMVGSKDVNVVDGAVVVGNTDGNFVSNAGDGTGKSTSDGSGDGSGDGCGDGSADGAGEGTGDVVGWCVSSTTYNSLQDVRNVLDIAIGCSDISF